MTTDNDRQVQLCVELLKQQQTLSRYNHYWRQPDLSSYLRYRLGGQ